MTARLHGPGGKGACGAGANRRRTDRLIMRDMFQRNGLAEPDWASAEKALADAGEARLHALSLRGAALPGVRDVLKEVSARSSWVSSVLTGNIADNARVKVAAFGLDPLLDLAVGAYGADALQRPTWSLSPGSVPSGCGAPRMACRWCLSETLRGTWRPHSRPAPRSSLSPPASTAPRSEVARATLAAHVRRQAANRSIGLGARPHRVRHEDGEHSHYASDGRLAPCRFASRSQGSRDPSMVREARVQPAGSIGGP